MKAIYKAKNVVKLEKMAEINDIIEQTYYFEQRAYELNNKIQANKSKISKYMGSAKKLDIQVDNDLKFSVRKNVIPKIEFYPEALKKKLPRDTYKQISQKKSYLINTKNLVKMLKKYGVPYDEFKKFLQTEEIIDYEKIDYLIEIGEIRIEDLHGCYRAEFDETITVRKI